MNKIFVASSLTIILILAQTANAQTIQGTITDPLTGKGIPNLTVTLGDCTTVTWGIMSLVWV